MKSPVGQVQLLLYVWRLLCGAAVAEVQFFKPSLPPPPQLHKFLFVLPNSLPSHVMTVAPLAAALATRGHEVHMLCDTPDVYKIPNVTCIDIEAKVPKLDDLLTFSCIDNFFAHIQFISSSIKRSAETIFSSPSINRLYGDRKQYDLIIVEQVAMAIMYPLVHETTFALISTVQPNPCQSARFGNLYNPTHVPSGVAYYPQPYSFLNRFKNFIETIGFCFLFGYLSSLAEERHKERFPELPSQAEVERNASLHFLTTNPVLDGPLPLLPNQVAVGGLVLRPRQPLPQDIAEFLEGEDPVVYVSFGVTFIRDDIIDQDKKKILISVLSRLPYKVIFKMKGLMKQRIGNILFHNDVPQQDILAHRNVKVFVSHCGLAGAQEAVHYGVPIIGFPSVMGHGATADILEAQGAGIKLSWSSLTEESFEKAVNEVMNNPSYQRNVAAMSRRFRDQPESPLDRAVFWAEFTARHKGAPHLQSPAKQLSWIQVLAIDIIGALLLAVYVGYLSFKKLSLVIYARFAPRNN